MQAVILAGGEGTRLKPYTTVIPKPLMPLGNHAILEIILKQLKEAGIKDVIVTLGYLGELIEAYLKTHDFFGMNLSLSYEKSPLGTAGPLTLIDNLEPDFLVMNGDILCNLDFGEMFEQHRTRENDITVAAYTKKVLIDLGVIETDQEKKVIDYIEKPTYSFLVSMGLYVIKKKAIEKLPKGQRLDLPELVLKAVSQKLKVRSYGFDGLWLDIGRMDDYSEAQEKLPEILRELSLSELDAPPH